MRIKDGEKILCELDEGIKIAISKTAVRKKLPGKTWSSVHGLLEPHTDLAARPPKQLRNAWPTEYVAWR